jgi:hypothetical protein
MLRQYRTDDRRAATSRAGRTGLPLDKKTAENTEEKKPESRREKFVLVFLAATILVVTAAWFWLLYSGFWALIEWVSEVITAHG